jgi:transposase
MAVATADERASEVKHHRRAPNALTFRLEYFPDQIGALPAGDSPPTPLKNWDRVFVISDRLTLEQFASVIIDLLAWDEDHLYEFHIAGTVYVHMGDPCSGFFVVDVVNPCVSCAIRLHYLNLSPSTTVDFVFDLGRCHLFRLTLLEASPHRGDKPLPFLVSHRGQNLHQYSGEISGRDRRRIEENPPTINRARSCGNTSSVVRFVRAEDCATLLKWRESNDKRLWEKAVTILENRNLSLEEIAEKIERPVNVLQRWILGFNHRGMLGLDPPRKNRSPGKREAAAEIRKKRLLDILHDRPRSYGINRASWNRPSLAKAYAGKYGEQVSEASVSRALRETGYSIKKARRVLTSPDPEYREKVEQVLNTLQTLKPDERFFFIDYLGPLRVKKYGGRMFAAKGDVPTVPQMQAHKGSITMAGAPRSDRAYGDSVGRSTTWRPVRVRGLPILSTQPPTANPYRDLTQQRAPARPSWTVNERAAPDGAIGCSALTSQPRLPAPTALLLFHALGHSGSSPRERQHRPAAARSCLCG